MSRCLEWSISKVQTRAHPDADVGSDHDLRWKLRVKRPSSLLYEKLKNSSMAEFCKASVGSIFATLNLVNCDEDTLDGNIKKVLLSIAQKVGGR